MQFCQGDVVRIKENPLRLGTVDIDEIMKRLVGLPEGRTFVRFGEENRFCSSGKFFPNDELELVLSGGR